MHIMYMHFMLTCLCCARLLLLIYFCYIVYFEKHILLDRLPYLDYKVILKKQSGHMAGVCLSVTSHLNTMAHGDTWGRVKAQFGPGCRALINRRFLPSATLPLKTPSRTNHHKKPWRLSITTLDYLQFFLLETMGLSSPVICGDHGLQRTTLPHTW